MEIINNVINDIKSSFHEKMLKRELRIITHYLQSFQWSIVGVECTLYHQGLLQTSLERKAVINRCVFLDMLDKFIDANCKNKGTAWAVKTMYHDYLVNKYKSKYITISDVEVDLIKEIVWVSYYVGQKDPDPFDVRSPEGLIEFLADCSSKYRRDMVGTPAVILRRITANIISFKNAKADLIPYPECSHPDDLIELISVNCPWEVMILNLLRELKHHEAKRFHYTNYVVELLREKIAC